MKIYYIHGFASCAIANYDKQVELKTIFPRCEIEMLEYDSASTYDCNMTNLTTRMNKSITDRSIIIGTSLGGFYALALSYTYRHFNVKCVLLNPAIHPPSDLKRYIGVCKHNYTGMDFLLTDSVVNSYADANFTIHVNSTVTILCVDDDVIDPYFNAKVMSNRSRVFMVEGTHRIHSLLEFEDIFEYVKAIV